MKKRTIALLLSAALMTMVLSACGDQKPENSGSDDANSSRAESNEIAIGIPQDLGDSLDPYQMIAAGTREILFNVYEGLYKPTATGDFVPAVAEDYAVSEDGLRYTFTLRSGVLFHNGDTVGADDVVYSFKTCAAATVDTSLSAALSNVADVSAADESTVTVTLSVPDSDFLAYVASVYIVPDGYEDCATAPVGTGPFRFVSRSVQENVILEKFADYWGEPAQVDRVTCKIYEDNTALITALNAGSVDIVAHLSADQLNGLNSNYNVQLTADGRGTKLGSSMYPAFVKYFDDSLTGYYSYDPDKAKALLTEAGYGDGFNLKITVPSNYPPHVNAAQVMVEQLAAVGITAELSEVEWNTWLQDVYANRNFEATVIGFDASNLTANALLQRWTSDADKNMINFNNSEYDALIAQANETTDDAARTELYLQAERILTEQAANVYVQDLADFVAINKQLSGYEFYPLYVMDLAKIAYTG